MKSTTMTPEEEVVAKREEYERVAANATNEDLLRVFGRQSNSKLAHQISMASIEKYQALKREAIKRNLFGK